MIFSVYDTTVNYDTTLKSSNIEIAQHALQKSIWGKCKIEKCIFLIKYENDIT